MSLAYDPSAIRYASIQEAYGMTWTFQKSESDGAQIWKNTKGQEAVVLKPLPVVLRPVAKDPSWSFDGIDELVQTASLPSQAWCNERTSTDCPMINESTEKGNFYFQLGVGISSKPSKTCAILASLLPSGTMQIHDEAIVDRELSREEVEQLSKYIASCFDDWSRP